MRFSEILGLVVVVAGVVALWTWYWANRVDRLNRRVDQTRDTLRYQMTRRAAIALDLALSGLLDPASSLILAEAARTGLDALDGAARLGAAVPAHSELSEAMRLALGDEPSVAQLLTGPGEGLVKDVADQWYRLILARRFYNEAVGQARRLRSRRGVRWFRLAGRTPDPQTCEMDDAWPEGLGKAPG